MLDRYPKLVQATAALLVVFYIVGAIFVPFIQAAVFIIALCIAVAAAGAGYTLVLEAIRKRLVTNDV